MVRTTGQGFGEEVGLTPGGGGCCGLPVRMAIHVGLGGTRTQGHRLKLLREGQIGPSLGALRAEEGPG